MSLPATSGVYEIRNIVNGKTYIGSAASLRRRWKEHRGHLRRGTHHSEHLQNAWNKYGEDAFMFTPLVVCPPDEARVIEQQYIDEREPEYNIARNVVAPMLGREFTAEHRARIGDANRGRKYPPEFGAAISARMLGVKIGPHSAEHNKKIGESNLGYQKALGYKHTPEGKEKISKALTGKERTPEHCTNISIALTGRKCPWVAESNRRRALANKLSQENQQ